NRGWLPWPDRRHLPGVPIAACLLQLEAEVVAEAEPGFRLRGASTQGWPRLITQLDPAVLAGQLDLDPPPLIARLQPGSAAALRLEWPALSMSHSKHTGYAVQWFTMAAALLALFFWAGYHRPVSGGNNNNDEHDSTALRQTAGPAEAAGASCRGDRPYPAGLADGETADRHPAVTDQSFLPGGPGAERERLAGAGGARRLRCPLAPAGHRTGGLRRGLPDSGARGAADPRRHRARG